MKWDISSNNDYQNKSVMQQYINFFRSRINASYSNKASKKEKEFSQCIAEQLKTNLNLSFTTGVESEGGKKFI